jgi:hypothetical protein
MISVSGTTKAKSVPVMITSDWRRAEEDLSRRADEDEQPGEGHEEEQVPNPGSHLVHVAPVALGYRVSGQARGHQIEGRDPSPVVSRGSRLGKDEGEVDHRGSEEERRDAEDLGQPGGLVQKGRTGVGDEDPAQAGHPEERPAWTVVRLHQEDQDAHRDEDRSEQQRRQVVEEHDLEAERAHWNRDAQGLGAALDLVDVLLTRIEAQDLEILPIGPVLAAVHRQDPVAAGEARFLAEGARLADDMDAEVEVHPEAAVRRRGPAKQVEQVETLERDRGRDDRHEGGALEEQLLRRRRGHQPRSRGLVAIAAPSTPVRSGSSQSPKRT